MPRHACARHALRSTSLTRSDQNPAFPLLGRRIIARQVKWGSNHLKIYGEAAYIPGYWEWTEDVLDRFDDILTTSSIYTAVYASLYTYDKDLHIMRAFFESWCHKTNTLHTMAGELSISLWDLHKLGRLPIDGDIYDETVPQLDFLRERDSAETCKFLFAAFRHLVKRPEQGKTVSSNDWIKFWCKRPTRHIPPRGGRKTINAPKFTENPNGKLPPRTSEWSQEEAVFERIEVNGAMREKTYLAAFLTCWLCAFVLPDNDNRFIRPTTFVIASLMAEGRKFSLAIPVLTSVYSGLYDLVISSRPGSSKSYFPAHYLYGWLAYYFNTHHEVSSPPPGPAMVVYSGARGAKAYTDDGARRLIHEGQEANVSCFILNRNKVEILIDDGHLDPMKFGYLASLRSSHLTLRIGNSFHTEPYNPHRFSRQFGFCQDTPGMLRGVHKRTVTRHEALELWKLLLFSNSQSRVFLPCHAVKWYENVTINFSEWWKNVDTSDLRRDWKVLAQSTSDPHRSKKEHHSDALDKTTPTGPSDGRKERKNVAPVLNSDGESEVDPKHERKRKRPALHVDNHLLSDRFFEDVPSSSHMPSQELQGDVAVEMNAILPLDMNQHAVTRPLSTAPRKGKELALLNKLTPQNDVPRSIPTGDGSLSGAASEGSTVSPNLVNPGIQLNVENHCPKFVTPPDSTPFVPPAKSFYPAGTVMCTVFERAIRDAHREYLSLLKDASYSEIDTVAASAPESYHGIYALKGDPTALRQKVDAYVGAVKAFLKVEKLATECKRPETSENDLLLQHRRLDDARALLDQAQAQRLTEATELSDIESKIVSLETELSRAREMKIILQQNLDARDISLTTLQAQVRNEEGTLARLEAVPVLSAEEEQRLAEQKAQLDRMRDSLLDD